MCNMKKIVYHKEYIGSLARILISGLLVWKIIEIWSMGGNITDWYMNEAVLRMVRESFLCNDGLLISMAVISIFGLIDIVHICNYCIRYFLLEKQYQFKTERIYKLIWSIVVCASLFMPFQAYRMMKPYHDAVSGIACEAELAELEKILTEGRTAMIYVTRRGCRQCSQSTQQLLNILPKANGSVVHYDTAKDREEHAEELHQMLERLSVETVPTIIFVKGGNICDALEGDFGEETLESFIKKYME